MSDPERLSVDGFAILLSVHPHYAEQLTDGVKTIEVSTEFIPMWGVGHRVLFYATAPVKKVIGGAITHGSTDTREITNPETEIYNFPILNYLIKEACLTPEEHDDYTGDSYPMFYYQVKKPFRFDRPRDLSEFGITHPPQSYRYLTEVPV